MDQNQLDDWYGVLPSEFKRRVGAELFKRYSKLSDLLKAVYPDHPWDMERFGETQYGYWTNVNNVLKELTKAEKKLGIIDVSIDRNCGG